MIPKIIHYIWLGGKPLPEQIKNWMESWTKFCPDYTIKRWDESNLDINSYKYTKQAYKAKKFAFCSDVFRFDILYRFGGIYLDIDVELIKNIDDVLKNKIFFAFESKKAVAPGLIMGSEKGNPFLKSILDIYKNKAFLENGLPSTTTVCQILTEYLEKMGLNVNGKSQMVKDIKIYGVEYFNPKYMETITITEKTYSIHHYYASWTKRSFWEKVKTKFIKCFNKVFNQKKKIK